MNNHLKCYIFENHIYEQNLMYMLPYVSTIQYIHYVMKIVFTFRIECSQYVLRWPRMRMFVVELIESVIPFSFITQWL